MRTQSVVEFAQQILDMRREIERLRGVEMELRALQDQHDKLLMDSIRHGEHMVGGMLQLAMKPGVLDAISAAKATEAA